MRPCIKTSFTFMTIAALATIGIPVVNGPRSCRAEEAKPARWALLISAEDYKTAPPLQFTTNDVRHLSDTLIQYGGYEKTRILEITDHGRADSEKPLKATLDQALPKFLKRPAAGDTIIVYFSGHGFKDKAGKLYLAPVDFDPARPVETGVSAEWFRSELEGCQAAVKLLIIDACHAGAEKAVQTAGTATAKDLESHFRRSAGVVTLASSTADETSQIWEFKQQSLFSYWLNQGLKGHADTDGDGSVNIDELYRYVETRVSQTARVRFRKPQTPARIIGSSATGVPEIVRLKPQRLKQVLADMADQIAGMMEENELPSLGVLEFTNDILDESLGRDFGLLGRSCSEQLERNLVERCAGKFSVVDRSRLQDALGSQRFTLESLGSNDALSNLSKEVEQKTKVPMPAIAKGTLYDRSSHIVNLRCKLLQTVGNNILGYVGGPAALTESEWAMIGRSVQISDEDRRPTIPVNSDKPQPIVQQVIQRADEHAQEGHPMLDAKFPYRVHMFVNDVERKPVFRGNDCFFPVKRGDVFVLGVQNATNQKVRLRLLVDGLNILPERVVENGTTQYRPAQRVNLDEARAWFLNPNSLAPFRGFVNHTGRIADWNKFKVSDATQSLAVRRGFTDELGLITAAFYHRKGNSRGPLGIAPGELERGEIQEVRDEPVGNLITVLHFQYVEEAPN